MNSIKVLIADDERDILDIMAKKIAQEGFLVVTAHDGQEAWEKIVSELPDVVVLDLSMPRMDGLGVLKNLRKTPPCAKWIPVIIVSGQGELQDVHQGLSLEADHYLIKPCPVNDILKAIELMVSLIPLRKSSDELGKKES